MPRHSLLPLALLAGALSVSAGPPTFEVDLVPPPAGVDSTFSTGLFDGGTLLGYAAAEAFDPLASPFVYRRGSLSPLAQPTDSLNFPLGGAHAGFVTGSSSNQPYLWRRGQAFPLPPAGGLPSGFAYDANRSGTVVGAVFNDLTGSQFPAHWPKPQNPGLTLPGFPGLSPEGAAFAINEAGQIAGVTGGGAVVFFGARWDPQALTPLKIGPLNGAQNSEVTAINDLGDVVGRSSFDDGTIEAMVFIDDGAVLTGLGFLDGSFSVARGINNARQVVGAATVGGVSHAFLWLDGVLFDLNDLVDSSAEPLEYLSNAVAIDDTGRIAAEAVVETPGGEATRMALLTPLGAPR
jgi:probable HAF family extracellular repeat protein